MEETLVELIKRKKNNNLLVDLMQRELQVL